MARQFFQTQFLSSFFFLLRRFSPRTNNSRAAKLLQITAVLFVSSVFARFEEQSGAHSDAVDGNEQVLVDEGVEDLGEDFYEGVDDVDTGVVLTQRHYEVEEDEEDYSSGASYTPDEDSNYPREVEDDHSEDPFEDHDALVPPEAFVQQRAFYANDDPNELENRHNFKRKIGPIADKGKKKEQAGAGTKDNSSSNNNAKELPSKTTSTAEQEIEEIYLNEIIHNDIAPPLEYPCCCPADLTVNLCVSLVEGGCLEDEEKNHSETTNKAKPTSSKELQGNKHHDHLEPSVCEYHKSDGKYIRGNTRALSFKTPEGRKRLQRLKQLNTVGKDGKKISEIEDEQQDPDSTDKTGGAGASSSSSPSPNGKATKTDAGGSSRPAAATEGKTDGGPPTVPLDSKIFMNSANPFSKSEEEVPLNAEMYPCCCRIVGQEVIENTGSASSSSQTVLPKQHDKIQYECGVLSEICLKDLREKFAAAAHLPEQLPDSFVKETANLMTTGDRDGNLEKPNEVFKTTLCHRYRKYDVDAAREEELAEQARTTAAAEKMNKEILDKDNDPAAESESTTSSNWQWHYVKSKIRELNDEEKVQLVTLPVGYTAGTEDIKPTIVEGAPNLDWSAIDKREADKDPTDDEYYDSPVIIGDGKDDFSLSEVINGKEDRTTFLCTEIVGEFGEYGCEDNRSIVKSDTAVCEVSSSNGFMSDKQEFFQPEDFAAVSEELSKKVNATREKDVKRSQSECEAQCCMHVDEKRERDLLMKIEFAGSLLALNDTEQFELKTLEGKRMKLNLLAEEIEQERQGKNDNGTAGYASDEADIDTMLANEIKQESSLELLDNFVGNLKRGNLRGAGRSTSSRPPEMKVEVEQQQYEKSTIPTTTDTIPLTTRPGNDIIEAASTEIAAAAALSAAATTTKRPRLRGTAKQAAKVAAAEKKQEDRKSDKMTIADEAMHLLQEIT